MLIDTEGQIMCTESQFDTVWLNFYVIIYVFRICAEGGWFAVGSASCSRRARSVTALRAWRDVEGRLIFTFINTLQDLSSMLGGFN